MLWHHGSKIDNVNVKQKFQINKFNGKARFKNNTNYLNTNIYSYFETSGGQSSDLYLNVVHFFNISVNYTSVAA